MKKPTGKQLVIIIAALLIAGVIVAVAATMALRVDSPEAKEIALKQAGGGEIITEEISREALVNEYSYLIVNGDKWYEIEISGFGRVTEVESGVGSYLPR